MRFLAWLMLVAWLPAAAGLDASEGVAVSGTATIEAATGPSGGQVDVSYGPPVAGSVSEEVELDAGPTQAAKIKATDGAVRIDYRIPVTIDDEGVLVRPLPTPWNPAFANEGEDGEGWQTEVLVETPDGLVTIGSTTGNESVYVNSATANGSNHIILRVHAPAGALNQPISQRLNYELTRHDDAVEAGSGGSLQDSIPVILTLDVLPTDEPPQSGFGEPPSPNTSCGPLCGARWQGLAALTLLGLTASFGGGYVLSRSRGQRVAVPTFHRVTPRLSQRLVDGAGPRRAAAGLPRSQARLERF